MIDQSHSLLARPFPYDRPPCSRTAGHRLASSSRHRRATQALGEIEKILADMTGKA